MLQVVEINAIEHLEAMRLRWTALLYQTRGGSMFHALDWLKLYWQYFGARQRLRVLLVQRSGTVLGILPLVVREEATAAGPVVALTYPTISPSHFFGPIGPNPTATLLAALRHLAGQSRDWDVLSLASIGEHDYERTTNAMRLAGFSGCADVQSTLSKVCFDASWTDTHLRWPSKAVGCLQRQGPAALDGNCAPELAGKITFERIRPLGGLHVDDQTTECLVEECFALNWHSSIAHDASIALLRDLAAVASRLGMLDLNLLSWDGRVIAFSLNVHFDGVIQQICAGETGESLRFAPTSVLTLQMLQDSFWRKDRGLYFAESNEGVTNLRATHQLPAIRYQHRATTPLRRHLTRLGEWLASPLKNA